ncbi:MAG: hypothetical protein M0R03_17090 [Novosphingobium sp.]|nr:hypothetical protein [Novosphingobium sp.]
MYILDVVLSDPLSENFTFLLIATFLYFALIILRYKSGARVWSLLSVGILIYLMTQFSHSIPMVITLIGISIYQLYDTFMGFR